MSEDNGFAIERPHIIKNLKELAESNGKDEKEIAREARRRMKEERLRRKERKMRRKSKLESDCLAEKMNCFNHDNQHWRTPPLWTDGPFCFCMNANNNTYSCLRTINKTHNFLYCEFVTGLVTFYNLRIDPFEQWNRAPLLTLEEKSYLHDTLNQLKGCRGTRQCTVSSSFTKRQSNFKKQHSSLSAYLGADNKEPAMIS